MKMGSRGIRGLAWRFAIGLSMGILLMTSTATAKRSKKSHNKASMKTKMNSIDECWRWNPDWQKQRQQLATCSVGYAGKMRNNTGPDLTHYRVTDPGDNPVNPKPGTLRYGASSVPGKVWITFERDMRIKLQKPLMVSSFTAIDGRGASVHIAGGACLLLHKVSNVIIHGLRIHHCRAKDGGDVVGPEGKLVRMGPVDGDAIRLVTSWKVWIDHNTLFEGEDGLIDVTRGSGDITISNNWFRNHNKVMLLGHDDGYLRDRNMKVTVVFNYFGPDLNQRMPRIRHGYAHVANNVYEGWGLYAIGGSMNPSLKSEANLFIAPKSGNKEVTWKGDGGGGGSSSRSGSMASNFQSVRDMFENGACFNETEQQPVVKPRYNGDQYFPVADARLVRSLTRFSGALKCTTKPHSRC